MINFKKVNIFICVLLVASTTCCSSLIVDNVQIVTQGATVEQIHREFGSPENEETSANGYKIEVYKLAEATKRCFNYYFYVMHFDPSGYLYKYVKLTDDEYVDWQKKRDSIKGKNLFYKKTTSNYEGVFFVKPKYTQVVKNYFSRGYALLAPVYDVEEHYLVANRQKSNHLYETLSQDNKSYNSLNLLVPIFEFEGPPRLIPNWEKTKKVYDKLKGVLNLLPFEATKEYNSFFTNYYNKAYQRKINKSEKIAEERISSRTNFWGRATEILKGSGMARYLSPVMESETLYNFDFYQNVIFNLTKFKFNYIISTSTKQLDLISSYTDKIAEQNEDNIVRLKHLKDNYFIDPAIHYDNSLHYSATKHTRKTTHNTTKFQESMIKFMNEEKRTGANKLNIDVNLVLKQKIKFDFLDVETFKTMQHASSKALSIASVDIVPIPKDIIRNIEETLQYSTEFLIEAKESLKISSGLKSTPLAD